MNDKKELTFHKIELDLYPPFKMGVKDNQYYILSTMDKKLPTNSKVTTMAFRILFDMANNIGTHILKEYQDEYCLLTPYKLYFHSKDLNKMKQFKRRNDDNNFCEYYPSSYKESDNNNMVVIKGELETKKIGIDAENDKVLISFTIFNEIVVLSFSLDHIYEDLEYFGMNDTMLLRSLELMIRRHNDKYKCIPEELKDEYCLLFGDKVWYHSKNYEDIVKHKKENPYLNYMVYFPKK